MWLLHNLLVFMWNILWLILMLSLYHTVLNTEVLVSQHVDATAVSALV